MNDKFKWIIGMLADISIKKAKETIQWLSEGWMLFILHIAHYSNTFIDGSDRIGSDRIDTINNIKNHKVLCSTNS